MAPKNHRLCISCRQTRHRDQLWRIVRTAGSQEIKLDSGMGRSAYLCPTLTCLSAAQKKNKLSRMLRAPVPPEIYQCLEQRLLDQDSRDKGLPEMLLEKSAIE